MGRRPAWKEIDPALSAPAVISIENVSFSYGGPNVALQDASLSIRRGDFACIVGPNGGGKTTLLKLIIGLLQPGEGCVRLFGRPPAQSRRRVGYMPQRAGLDPQFPVRVLDVVLMGRLGRSNPLRPLGKADKEQAASVLAQVGLADLQYRPLSALSEGQRQRALIARALACDPDLLLLDEPTSNLDVASQDDLYALLHALNKRMTIVMVSHDVAFVSKFVKTIVCVNRSVVVHAAEDISGDLISEVFGYGKGMKMIMHDHSHFRQRADS